MKSLYKSYKTAINSAYIIRIKNNKISEDAANRCIKSCEDVNMPFTLWDAYDGVDTEGIKAPEHLKNHTIMNMLKISEHYMRKGEVACALSHISLWSKCLEIEEPIVILEHDAIMLKAYLNHELYNSICYLGCYEQFTQNFKIYLTPPHGTEGPNHHFICRAHAYAIDPAVARTMLCYVLKYGIHSSLDTLLRADLFPIHQIDLFAYDNQESESTIKNRPKEGRPGLRNDHLIF
jgi:hypothetical protein